MTQCRSGQSADVVDLTALHLMKFDSMFVLDYEGDVTCRDGSVYERTTEEFPGTPAMPLSCSDLDQWFHVMPTGRNPDLTRGLFERLGALKTSHRSTG